MIGGVTLSAATDRNDENPSLEAVTLVQCYKKNSCRWTMKEDLPEPVHDAMGATDGKFQYFILSNCLNTLGAG